MQSVSANPCREQLAFARTRVANGLVGGIAGSATLAPDTGRAGTERQASGNVTGAAA
ncbi:large exoproteins [Zymobacter palmae]|uniref:Large exoproteins n=1 Tax=Zymobacter palmae TaxID=33074 RepID=A0A348HI46_9GAMM|nr:large exoproteins [Zymobacter palmae]